MKDLEGHRHAEFECVDVFHGRELVAVDTAGQVARQEKTLVLRNQRETTNNHQYRVLKTCINLGLQPVLHRFTPFDRPRFDRIADASQGVSHTRFRSGDPTHTS